jgi:uncharacterized protein
MARRAGEKPAPKRREGYASVARGLGIIGAATLSIDLLNDKPGITAFLVLPPLPVLFAWTILTTVICLGISVGFLFLRRLFKRPLPPSIVSMLPRTRRDLSGWTGISLVAGVFEEYIYRGFCLILVASTTSSWLLALLLVTLAFGIGHGYQDLLGVVRALMAGAVLAIPVLVLGALTPSILAHVTIDLFAGLSAYFGLLKRWKLVP